MWVKFEVRHVYGGSCVVVSQIIRKKSIPSGSVRTEADHWAGTTISVGSSDEYKRKRPFFGIPWWAFLSLFFVRFSIFGFSFLKHLIVTLLLLKFHVIFFAFKVLFYSCPTRKLWMVSLSGIFYHSHFTTGNVTLQKSWKEFLPDCCMYSGLSRTFPRRPEPPALFSLEIPFSLRLICFLYVFRAQSGRLLQSLVPQSKSEPFISKKKLVSRIKFYSERIDITFFPRRAPL